MEFVDAMSDPAHPDRDDVMDWHGERFDPKDIELDTIEATLGRIRGQRRKGRGRGKRT